MELLPATVVRVLHPHLLPRLHLLPHLRLLSQRLHLQHQRIALLAFGESPVFSNVGNALVLPPVTKSLETASLGASQTGCHQIVTYVWTVLTDLAVNNNAVSALVERPVTNLLDTVLLIASLVI